MPNKKNFIRKARRSAPESKMSKGTYDKTRQMKEAEVGGGFAIDADDPERAPRAIAVKKAASTVKKKKAKSGYNK